MNRFTSIFRIGIFVFYSPAVLSGDLCLAGLGPNWEDIDAEATLPVEEIAELLKLSGELRPDETSRWFRDKAGRVIHCGQTFDTWHSLLFERREGQWKELNSVKGVL